MRSTGLVRRLSRGAEVRNIAWLLGEYGIRVGLVLVTTALIARHLGPTEFAPFGLLFALITAVLPLTDAGLNHLVSRVVVAKEAPLETILGTAAGLRLAFCLVGVPVLALLAVLAGPDYPQLVAFALLAGVLNALSSLAVLDYYFQSQLKARLSAIARTSALTIICIAQLALIAANAGVGAFMLTLCLQQPLFGIFYYLLFRITGGRSLRHWRLDRGFGLGLLRRSSRLLVSNIMDMTATRAPIVMLAAFGTPAAVGLLTAATRPVIMLTVLPNAVGATLLPRFVKTHSSSDAAFDRVLRLTTAAFVGAGTLLAAGFILGAPLIVGVLYGDEFEGSVRAMQLLAPILIFVFLRAVISKWLITVEAYNWSMASQAMGAVTALVGGFLVLRVNPTASTTALLLLAQAVAASLVALVVTSRGRRFLAVTIGGWFTHRPATSIASDEEVSPDPSRSSHP